MDLYPTLASVVLVSRPPPVYFFLSAPPSTVMSCCKGDQHNHVQEMGSILTPVTNPALIR